MRTPNNPYPESVFMEPTAEEFELAHKVLKENGLSLDKFSGSTARKVWATCCNEWEDALENLFEEEL